MIKKFIALFAVSVLLAQPAFASRPQLGGTSQVTVSSGSVALTSVVPGTGATNLGKAEDAAHTSGDTGVVPLYVLKNSINPVLAGTDGDYIPGNTDANGRIRVYEEALGSDGVQVSSVLNAGDTGSTILASHGAVYSIHISNQHAAANFWVKFYNASTPPTHLDTPVLRLFVKAQTARELTFPKGINFSTGIGVRCVSEAADNGTTGASTNECTVNTTYKQ